jgi:hypothetical protein
MPFPAFGIEIARNVVACVLGAGLLWQAAKQPGFGDGEAVVHVAASGVVVRIDDDEYPYEPWPGPPIVCPLRSGTHTLTMTRDSQTLHTETFTIAPSRPVVLTAWDRSGQDVPASQPPPPDQPRDGANGNRP